MAAKYSQADTELLGKITELESTVAKHEEALTLLAEWLKGQGSTPHRPRKSSYACGSCRSTHSTKDDVKACFQAKYVEAGK